MRGCRDGRVNSVLVVLVESAPRSDCHEHFGRVLRVRDRVSLFYLGRQAREGEGKLRLAYNSVGLLWRPEHRPTFLLLVIGMVERLSECRVVEGRVGVDDIVLPVSQHPQCHT